MSSTLRGSKRAEYDYYRTPQKPITQILEALIQYDVLPNDKPINQLVFLDPCAGGDNTNPTMPYPHAITNLYQPLTPIRTVDIREDSSAQYHLDFLSQTNEELQDTFYDVIITNPPFDIATQIIETAHLYTRHKGIIVMLLRLNFWGSIQRQPFFQKYPPAYCFIHPRRMSFTPDNKTDSIEYAHFVWVKDERPPYCKTILLTP
jgi:hypothetical protein